MKKIMNFIGGFLSNSTIMERTIIILMLTSFALGANDSMSTVILVIVTFSITESIISRMYNNKKTK